MKKLRFARIKATVTLQEQTLPDFPTARIGAAREDWRILTDDNREEAHSDVFHYSENMASEICHQVQG